MCVVYEIKCCFLSFANTIMVQLSEEGVMKIVGLHVPLSVKRIIFRLIYEVKGKACRAMLSFWLYMLPALLTSELVCWFS
jgi:hypothetical protein